MRTTYLPFHLPSIGEDEISEVVDTLRSGWLTTGSKTSRFEEAFRRYTGARHAVAVNSGTAALHLALASINLQPGDHVIVPTLTFAATAEVACYFRAVPRLVDIDPRSCTLDVEAVERMLHQEPQAPFRAVIPVHYGGYPCDMDPLLAAAKSRGLLVIDDAAHALPAFYKGRQVGTIADISAFSFYATKTITTGEGGMITTADEELAARMRIMSLHGITHDAWNRYGKGGNWYYEITCLGYKYNLTDIASSIGIRQLARSDEFHRRRKDIARLYTEHFLNLPGIGLLPAIAALHGPSPSPVEHAWHLYPVLVDPEVIRIDRARFIEELRKRNIGASVHFIPLHYHPYYRDTFGYRQGDFPAAEAFYARCISLPIYPAMTDNDVWDVIEAVTDIARTFKK